MDVQSHAERPRSYPRGEDTRQRILETAIELFAGTGYEGTTTRLLAERAGVTLPAIQYYFGGKEGLYRAAIAHIVGQIEARMAPTAEQAGKVLAQRDASRRALLAQLFGMLDAFAALVIGGTPPQSWGLFLSRAEIENSAALAPLYDSMMRRTIGPCAALIGRLLDRPAADEQILLRTLTILGQILIFHRKCGNKPLERALGLVDPSEERVRSIQSLVRQQTAAILRAARSARP